MNWGQFLASHAWELAAAAVLLACSGFFSGSETALFTLSRRQLQRLRASGAGGRIVAGLMSRPRRVLNTLLLGNMFVNVGYAAISAVLVLDLERRGAPAWMGAAASVAPLVCLILVGEVAPKVLALSLGERWALVAAGPVTVIERAFRPLLSALDAAFVRPVTLLVSPRRPAARAGITDAEMEGLLDLSARRGIISHDTSALLREIVDLTGLRVADIMVPRVDIIAYDVDAPNSGLIELFRRTRLRKIPVYEKDLDRVLGVVHAKRLLLNPSACLRDLIVRVPFVPEAAKLERVLLQFRVTRTQMAIVVDEYGGTAGLVTLHDILEEIVGAIPDPADLGREPPVQRLSEREYVLNGNLPVHEWADAFKLDLSGGRISTVGGFVTSLLGRIPRVGDAADYRNLRFTVLSMRKRRVEKLRLELREEAS